MRGKLPPLLALSALPALCALFPASRSVDEERLREQCALWARWLGEQPALPGKPCNFVNASQPERVFRVPENAADSLIFQPFAGPPYGWARFQQDSFLAGGTGPIPTMRQYLRLLRASRLAANRSVHVVQVGAHTGRNESNEYVHHLLRANPTWTGTVIEPVPKIFNKLRVNYKLEMDRVQPMCVAIATYTGPCEMNINKRDMQTSTLALGEQAQGARCFHGARKCRFIATARAKGFIRPIKVNCSTLEDALARRRPELNVPVDVLVLDVEMFDYTLLRTMRLDVIRPLAIEFESKAMTMQQGAEVASLLALQGYLCRFSPADDMLKHSRKAMALEEYGDGKYNRADPSYEAIAPNWKRERKLMPPERKPINPTHTFEGWHALESVCFRMT
ncbi:hypothetical protein AB1Y20_002188 [Prymnesium parvum]|uniref:Methyltransferase FkbM domain-containing protein n=1 Tax=Prymnesium parvum TaxID=97485 RepID=A0AB34JAE6_PRYPA